MLKDNDGKTSEQWLDEMFEFELCSECGRDKDAHTAVLIRLGGQDGGCWFAKCEDKNEEDR